MMEQAMMEGARKQSVLNALAPTAPNPSSREMERQHILIIELFRRLDALTAAITKQKPPEVNVEGAVVNVAAAEVNVPPTVVNVEQPDIKLVAPNITVESPTVNVAAPAVTVNPPQVHVSAPNVTVAAPSVNVAAPSVSIKPEIHVPYPTTLTFIHELDQKGNVIKSTVTAE